MVIGRFLVGIGIGVNTGLVPVYISEVTSFTMILSWLLLHVFQDCSEELQHVVSLSVHNP